jgi:hypothetical protein
MRDVLCRRFRRHLPRSALPPGRHKRHAARVCEGLCRAQPQQRIGEFGLAPPVVGQYRDRTEAQAGPTIEDPFRTVPPEDENTVAPAYAARGQQPRLTVDGRSEVGERDDSLALHDMRSRTPAACELQQMLQAARPLGVHAVLDTSDLFDRDLLTPFGC